MVITVTRASTCHTFTCASLLIVPPTKSNQNQKKKTNHNTTTKTKSTVSLSIFGKLTATFLFGNTRKDSSKRKETTTQAAKQDKMTSR